MTSTPTPLRRPGWVRVVLWTGGAVVAVVAALLLWFVAVLSGGWDDLLSPGGPSEDDAEVVAAGRQALEELARTPLPIAPVGAVAEQQQCQVGQHNWKIDDEFDLSCVATRTTLSPGRLPAFREQALALHQALAADGWSSGHADIPTILVDYWDRRSAAGGAAAPGDLPPADYTRGDLRLEVRWMSEGGLLTSSVAPSGATFVGVDGGTVDPRTLLSQEQYAVALEVSTESFRD